MAIKEYKPITPGQRGMTSVDYSQLTAKEPYKPLIKRLKKNAGRNNQGRITVRHQGGGNKKLYRLIDFKQNKMDVPGEIKSLEYDPYRSAFISLVQYRDGDKRYILAYNGAKVGDVIITSENAELKPGNRMPIGKVPVGYQVHNIELRSGGGGKLVRSAGSFAEVLAHEGGFSTIRLGSKEVRKVPSSALATIGQVSNPDHNLVVIGKAGRSRAKGIRPTVRGSVMNPVDHPYGGGEGRQPRGIKRPKTKWGKVVGGKKTRRRKKWSNSMIVESRPRRNQ